MQRLVCHAHVHKADFCETLISFSKLRLSGKTLVSFSISTLNFFLRTLILILNSQKFSNSHSRISTINSRISEKSQPISYCGRKKCLKSRELYIALYHKRPLDWYAFKTMLLLLKDTMQVFKSPSQRWALILEKLRVSFSFSALKKFLENAHSHSQVSIKSLRYLILNLDSQ